MGVQFRLSIHVHVIKNERREVFDIRGARCRILNSVLGFLFQAEQGEKELTVLARPALR